ncbi:s-methyl-5-thioribose-1-phosphate isomerase [Treponema pedis]|uniref:s-methyl-5-thioribose-1-phosphate isomerase n=1 Tax=Treponema pedis TaxID=409322 RepID=UPI000412CEC5|nr:s-methyl-5-thioribose-1-phosphate isomerase [Treponema pedis]
MELREDYNLGKLLKYENVAWFDEASNIVRILDRRIYPLKEEFVICKTCEDVARAVSDMVTQSGGPFSAAAMGMVLAAFQFKNLPKKQYIEKMRYAARLIAYARPTTSAEMERCTSESFKVFNTLVEKDVSSKDIICALKLNAIEQNNRRYKKNTEAGAAFANIVPDNSSILTQCFGETTVGGFLRRFNETGKKIKIFCAETRPFFQGARLTASLALDMGFDVTVITDNMPAFLMAEKKIDFCVSAADVITMDGYIINKIGTLQIAVCAKYFGIPYYAIGFPDKKYQTVSGVKIEYRNPEEALYAMGVRTAFPSFSENSGGVYEGVKGLYPAFDITPPELCTGIITGSSSLF